MYANAIRQLTHVFNNTLETGLDTVGNAIFARKLYTILADGPLHDVAGIIVGRMSVDLPADIFTDHPAEMEALANAFGKITMELYTRVSDYMTEKAALDYITEAAHSLKVSFK